MGVGKIVHLGYSAILKVSAILVEGTEHVEQHCEANRLIFEEVEVTSFSVVDSSVFARAAGWTGLGVLGDIWGSGRDTGQ